MKRGCIAEEMSLFLLVGLPLLATLYPGAAGGPDRRDREIVKFLVKYLKPTRLGKPAAPGRTP